MKVKIKKLASNAVLPTYAHPSDAGMDLTVTRIEENAQNFYCYFGLALEIPEGYMGLIFPRSSNCKKDLLLSNSVGIVDSHYRGEIQARFKKLTSPGTEKYKIGERAAQLVIIPYPHINWEEVTVLSETDRGANGHGSTGR